MKIFEITEAKEEMCSEACCGKPITECKCGPDCEHCDCHAKNKKVDEGYKSKLRKKAKHAGRRSGRRSNKKLRDEFQDTGIANEASTIPPMKKELDNLIRNVMSPEDGKRAFYIYVALNKAANSDVIDGSVIAYRKKLNALIQKYNSGGKKTGIFKPAPKSVQVPFDRNRKDLGNVIKTGVKGSYAVVVKAIKDYEDLIRRNPNHPKVPLVKAELAKLKQQMDDFNQWKKTQEGISEDAKEKFEPHMMYDPKTGEGKHAKVEKDHLDMKAKGWSHDKPKVKKVKEDVTSGGTSASSVANVSNPSITRNVKKPKKNKNGTAKNAQDSNSNLMTGQLIKR